MQMLSFLTSTVGGKILSGLVAIWTKDQAYLGLASEQALAMLQKSAGDYIEARKLKRLLEQIEDEILEALVTYLEAEFRDLKSGDKALLAKNAVETISTVEFYRACFEEALRLEQIALRFEKQIENAAKAASIGDIHAAQSIALFTFAKYLAVLEGLPTFSTDSLKFILRDTDEILDRVKSIELHVIGQVESTKKERDQEEANYRRLMSARLKNIDVFGVDTRSISKSYNLSLAYVNLTLNDHSSDTAGDAQKVLKNALDECGRILVLRGDPGSGKTTLLSWLALECVEGRISSSIPSLSELLPVFITVRQFSEAELPKSGRLLTSQFGHGEGAVDSEWAERRMRTGKTLFIVDGFDEVSSKRRDAVVRWIKDVLLAYPEAKFIVSTRSYAAAQLDELLSEFSEAEIDISMEPMNSEQISLFIENWYSAYLDTQIGAEQKARLEVAKNRLLERIKTNGTLRTLIRSPLICSLLCFVNADRDGFVPDQRGELYQLATENLLDRRDRERGVDHGAEIELSKPQKFKIIGYIAEYFFKRKSTQLDTRDVNLGLAEYLPSLGLKSEQSPEIIDYLCERSHILRSPTVSEVEFTHKTFLEYFYARRISDQNLVEVTQEAFFDEDAREVALFVFSMSNDVFIDKVLGGVLPRLEVKARKPKKNDGYVILLIQAAINQAAEVGPELRRRALSLVSGVLPPRSNDEAEQLAVAGDVVIDLLRSFATEEYRMNWLHLVHAIMNTFSEAAIFALLPYAKLNDRSVDKLLISGRRFFEGNTYARTIISQCRTVEAFVVGDWQDLEVVGSLPNLKTVSIRQFNDHWDDAKIDSVVSVKRVEITNAENVTDLSILAKFPNVEELLIDSCERIEDFDSIGSCTRLRSLTLYSSNLKDLDFAVSLKLLKDIDLSECSELSDVRALNKLEKIKSLLLPYSHLHDQINFEVEDIGDALEDELYSISYDLDEELRDVRFSRDIDQ